MFFTGTFHWQFFTGTFTAEVPGFGAIVETGLDECKIDVLSCFKGEHLFHTLQYRNLLRLFYTLWLHVLTEKQMFDITAGVLQGDTLDSTLLIALLSILQTLTQPF